MADPTIIAGGTTIAGRIHGTDGDLSVEGFVDGTIELSQTVQIAPQGRVNGEVRARQVIVEGTFQGDIVAQERVVLAATARAVATIEAPVVEMVDGAQLRGELTVGVDGEVSISAETPSSRRASTSRATTTRSTTTTTRREAPATTGASAATAAAPAATTTTTVVTEPDDEDDDSEPAPEPSEPKEESDQEVVTEEEIEEYREDFTVKELRDRLRDLDLRVSGTKDELIERLLAAEAGES